MQIETTNEVLKSLGVGNTPMIYVYNKIDLNKYAYAKDVRDVVRKKNKLEDEFVVGHVGRLCYQKNTFFLIDIFSEIYKKCKDTVVSPPCYSIPKSNERDRNQQKISVPFLVCSDSLRQMSAEPGRIA